MQKPVTKSLTIDYIPHTSQRLFHESNARFRIVSAGRKWGKTTACSMEAFNYLGKPNAVVWWVAPFYDVAMIGWRKFLTLIPRITIREINKKEKRITMINNATFWLKSADNPDALVGEGIDLLILDEAARIREKVWLETLRPNLDDPEHFGHMVAISTPRSFNWFYEAYLLGLKREKNWQSWFHPYQDMQGGFPSWLNPYMRPEDLMEAKTLPDRIYLQEYCARFLMDLGAVFRDILKARQGELEPHVAEAEYIAGVDWGRAHSYTVVTILNSKGHLVAYDRFRKTSWTLQVKRVANLLSEYKAKALCDNVGLGDPVFEMLYRHYDRIEGYKITNPSKSDIIENLAFMIETKGVTYPDIPELIEELSVFGMEQTANVIKYRAPKGFTDDFVISLALAAWQLREEVREPGYEFLSIY